MPSSSSRAVQNGDVVPPGDTSGYNVAVVGATTLKGKEIKEVLRERRFPIRRLVLLDAEEAGGRLTEFDDAPAIIYPTNKESFDDIAFAFFASSPAFTRDHWQMAEAKGCEIIDLSYFLETNPQAHLLAPAVESLGAMVSPNDPAGRTGPRISISAHPVAMAIAGIITQLSSRFPVERSVITVYEPVSEHGQAGVEELHQQTLKLLAFQKIPQRVFDAQVAFNLLPSYGTEARSTFQDVQKRMQNQVQALLPDHAAQPAIKLLQAPIFYGYAFSCFVELRAESMASAIEDALGSERFTVSTDSNLPPNVVTVAGSNEVLLAVEPDDACKYGYWIWGVLDNMRLAALNAVLIAEDLISAGGEGPSQ